MKYIDREGNITIDDSKQDQLLKKMYTTPLGRGVLKVLVQPFVSNVAGRFLDSGLSTFTIPEFVKRNNINMNDYEEETYSSYNEFFTRHIKKELRPLEGDENTVVSPCDGKLSVYRINENSRFTIKNTRYSVKSLLRSRELAKRYEGGTLAVFRLTVDDYHRYSYIDSGVKSDEYFIQGVYHTVNPVANDVYPIYKENTREFSLLKSDHFGTVLMMEVGALLVGRIRNYKGHAKVSKGEEKGRFEFGGSTVVLMFQKDAVKIDSDIWNNTKKGYETIVRMGQKIGVSLKAKEIEDSLDVKES